MIYAMAEAFMNAILLGITIGATTGFVVVVLPQRSLSKS